MDTPHNSDADPRQGKGDGSGPVATSEAKKSAGEALWTSLATQETEGELPLNDILKRLSVNSVYGCDRLDIFLDEVLPQVTQLRNSLGDQDPRVRDLGKRCFEALFRIVEHSRNEEGYERATETARMFAWEAKDVERLEGEADLIRNIMNNRQFACHINGSLVSIDKEHFIIANKVIPLKDVTAVRWGKTSKKRFLGKHKPSFLFGLQTSNTEHLVDLFDDDSPLATNLSNWKQLFTAFKFYLFPRVIGKIVRQVMRGHACTVNKRITVSLSGLRVQDLGVEVPYEDFRVERGTNIVLLFDKRVFPFASVSTLDEWNVALIPLITGYVHGRLAKEGLTLLIGALVGTGAKLDYEIQPSVWGVRSVVDPSVPAN
jgi:hypothetical protein